MTLLLLSKIFGATALFFFPWGLIAWAMDIAVSVKPETMSQEAFESAKRFLSTSSMVGLAVGILAFQAMLICNIFAP